jgi:hypothetical protein
MASEKGAMMFSGVLRGLWFSESRVWLKCRHDGHGGRGCSQERGAGFDKCVWRDDSSTRLGLKYQGVTRC